ncbi:unnamed protein product [Chrysoparadoxa australica]
MLLTVSTLVMLVSNIYCVYLIYTNRDQFRESLRQGIEDVGSTTKGVRAENIAAFAQFRYKRTAAFVRSVAAGTVSFTDTSAISTADAIRRNSSCSTLPGSCAALESLESGSNDSGSVGSDSARSGSVNGGGEEMTPPVVQQPQADAREDSAAAVVGEGNASCLKHGCCGCGPWAREKKEAAQSVSKSVVNVKDLSHSCPICLLDFDEGDSVSLLPCLHLYHDVCINEWINDKPTCPFCKQDLNLREPPVTMKLFLVRLLGVFMLGQIQIITRHKEPRPPFFSGSTVVTQA